MTRRLVLALLTFTLLLLVVSVVPLGVVISKRDHADYTNGTRALAHSLASLAEDSFDDTHAPVTPQRLQSAAGPDVSVDVVDLSGASVVAAGRRSEFPASLISRALAGRSVTVASADDVVAAVPVIADGSTRGAVVVARSDEPVESRVARLWAVLGGVSAVALLLSVALAIGAARWVAGPLRRLRETAHRWSEGSLHERANSAAGPPEVREVATALNVMAGRLDTLVHGSRAVVADVSHQLRTPLAAMRLRLELVRDELSHSPPDGSVNDDLVVALAETDRLSRLVDGLLTVARAESAESQPVPVDVAAVVGERRQAWAPVAEERGVRVDVGVDSQVAWASVTPGHLEQILDNLLDNALEVLQPGGRITVSVDQQTDHVSVSVTDDGPGMTEELQESAFHRFASGRPATGTGLGLAVIHRLVTVDGGSVRLRSAPGQGTTVTIELPTARAGAVTPAARLR